jgi:membrane protease YdiL (CAAX protease family)
VKLRWGLLVGGATLGALVAVGVLSTTLVLAAGLVVLVPGLAFGQLALLERLELGGPSLDRIALYRSSMLSIAVLGGLSFTDGFYSLGLLQMGLGTVRPVAHLVWGVALCLVSVIVIWTFDAVAQRIFNIQEPEFVRLLLPRTGREKAVFLLLSVFAGVGEEIAYRGFLLTAIALWSGSAAVALVVSSVAFALVHAYQATPGVIRTGVLGLLLGGSLLVTGSLVPAIVAHILIDWVMGLWLGPRIMGLDRERSEEGPMESPEAIDPDSKLV